MLMVGACLRRLDHTISSMAAPGKISAFVWLYALAYVLRRVAENQGGIVRQQAESRPPKVHLSLVAIAAIFVDVAFGMNSVSGAAPEHSAESAQRRVLAFTFDDLPYAPAANAEITLQNAQRVTQSILAILDEHFVPATAFVNESKLHAPNEFEARRKLLQQWLDSGVILGNHTYSHIDLNTATIEEFQRDVLRGEAVIRRLMKALEDEPLFFRHPYTHTGDSEAKKTSIDLFLTSRGYVTAPYTVDTQDYFFNEAYLFSKSQKEGPDTSMICSAYTDFVLQATEFAEKISVEIFGRNIPQTLLLHANDLNAECLDVLLAQLIQDDFEFASLSSVMEHPAYQSEDTFVTAYGPSWLWRWMKSRGMEVSFKGDPEPPDWIALLHQRAMQRAVSKP